MSSGNIVTASRAKYFGIFIFGLSVMFGIFVLRPVLGPHETLIASDVPRIALVDFQRFKPEKSHQRAANGASLYRAGDKRLTGASEGRCDPSG